MQKWLITADTKEWEHEKLFLRDGYIDWQKHLSYEIGDIVYIYAKLPAVGKIIFKTFVEDISESDDSVRICLIEHINREELSFKNLQNHGIKKTISPKGMRLNGELKSFIEKYSNFPFKSDEPRNMIYFGAPGTGKSFNLNKKKDKLLKNNENNYERVTFHPDYTYANFVGTYKPVPTKDENNQLSITYEYVPGPFLRTLVNALKNPYAPYVLVIEEINRANVASVLGDVFQLLDREDDDSQYPIIESKKNISEYPINISKDVTEYLIKELNIDEVPKDIRRFINYYWEFLLGENFDKITIPSNMFIWATMNSADQGVFPMDTAFKRRWDFEYLDIDSGESKIENIIIDTSGENWNLKDSNLSWNKLRRKINDKLLDLGVNEDKLIGPFFVFNEYVVEDSDESKEIILNCDEFKKIFENKVIMYLFEDAAKFKRSDLFKIESNLTFSNLCNKFEEKGLEIFCDEIKDEFVKNNGE